MAKSIEDMRMTRPIKPPRMLVYGVQGIGKTSFAAEWPDPIFIQCEEGEGNLEFPTMGEIVTWDDVLTCLSELIIRPHDRKTVVLDTLDAMQPLIWQHVCQREGWPDIEHGKDGKKNFGAGYVVVDREWNEFFGAVRALQKLGIAVVLIAHSAVVKFEPPTSDPYDRYVPKLHKRASALVQEEVDIVGFFNQRVTIKTNDNGFRRTTRAEGGGDRYLFLEERPNYLAKNRYQMPEKVEYKRGKGYEIIQKYFPQPTGKQSDAA